MLQSNSLDASVIPKRWKNPPPPWARTNENLAREAEERLRRGDPAVVGTLPFVARQTRLSVAHAMERDARDTQEAVELLNQALPIAVGISVYSNGRCPVPLQLTPMDEDYIRRQIRFERERRFGDGTPSIVFLWEACRAIARRAPALLDLVEGRLDPTDELLPVRLRLIGGRRWLEDEETEARLDRSGRNLAEAVLEFLRRKRRDLDERSAIDCGPKNSKTQNHGAGQVWGRRR